MELKGRFLTDHEILLLLGAELTKVKQFKMFNFTQTDQLIPFIEALINGDENLTLEGYSDPASGFEKSPLDKLSYVYIYSDLPFGSAYWHARSGQHGYNNCGFQERLSSDTIAKAYERDKSVGSCNTTDIFNQVGSFYLEHLTPCYDLFGMTPPKGTDLKQMATNLGYGNSPLFLVETLLNASILTLYNGKVVTLQSPINFMTSSAKYGLNNTSAAYTDMRLFGVNKESLPADIVIDLLSIAGNELNSFIDGPKQTIISHLSTNSSTVERAFYVISNNRVQFNGYVKKNDEVFLSLGSSNADNGMRYGSTGFGGYLESFLTLTDNEKTAAAFPLFNMLTYSSYRWNNPNPNDTIFFLDEEKLKTAGYFTGNFIEFKMEKDFFDSLNTTYQNITANVSSRKREFKEFKNGILHRDLVPETGKYDVAECGMLFTVMKNSKAKETIKKTQITRAINTSVSSFFTWITHFLIMDELTLLEKQTSMSIVEAFGYGFRVNALPLIYPKMSVADVVKEYQNRKYTKFSAMKTTIAAKVVSLYSDAKPTPIYSQSICFEADKFIKTEAYSSFNYWMGKLFNPVWASQNQLNDLFSPNTGDINFFIFKLSLPCAKTNFCDVNSYRGDYTDSPTYEQLSYIIENNAIVSSPNVEYVVQTGKGSNRMYSSYRNYGSGSAINFRNMFNLSEATLKTFTDLKTCRTFTEYNKWYTDNLPSLKLKVGKLKEEAAREMALEYLSILETYLSSAATAETPYLPAATVKVKKSRKKKADASENESEDSNSSETEESVVVAPESLEDSTKSIINILHALTANKGENNGSNELVQGG